MKKYFLLAIFVFLAGFVPAAQAQTACPGGGSPTAMYAADNTTITGYTCPTIETPPTSRLVVPTGQTLGGSGSGTSDPSACPSGSTKDKNGSCSLGYTPLEPIPGITPANGAYDLTSPTGFARFINAIFTIFISAGALLAVLMLTLGGIQYMTASAINNKTRALERAQAAVWGLLLIAGIWLVLNTINPNLLNFNFIACDPNNPVCSATARVNSTSSGGAAASNTSNTANNTPSGVACGDNFPNGCTADQYCATQGAVSGTVQVCSSNTNQSSNQACSSSGGTWTQGLAGNYCYLSAYTSQQSCASAGGTWQSGWVSNYCYK